MQQKPTVRIHALDSLRGIGAFFVLFIHCIMQMDMHHLFIHTPLRMLANGRSLVMFFFVLSGFVLAFGLHNSRQKSNFMLYLKRRFARIYLPYAGTGVMAYFCMMLPHWPLQGDLLGYFLLTGTNASIAPNPLSWSLVYELRVSLIVPLLCVLAWKYERLTIAAMVVLTIFETWGLIYLEMGQFPYGSDTFAGAVVLTVRYLVCIYVGIWLARCIIEDRPWLKKVQGKWIPILGVLAFILMSVTLDEPGTLGSVIIIVLVFRSPAFRAFLESKLSLWLARISYSLYLTHYIVVVFVVTYAPLDEKLHRVILAFFTAFLFGELYQRCVEAPSIKLAKAMK